MVINVGIRVGLRSPIPITTAIAATSVPVDPPPAPEAESPKKVFPGKGARIDGKTVKSKPEPKAKTVGAAADKNVSTGNVYIYVRV